MKFTSENWKDKKAQLVAHIIANENEAAKAIVDELSKAENFANFYTEFQDEWGDFSEYPLMAALYYGNQELFQYMVGKLPNLKIEDAISANHILINVAVTPCRKSDVNEIDEVKLANAQRIIKILNNNLNFDQKKKCNLLSLAIFFLDTEVVSSIVQEDRFAEIADEQCARNVRPINYAAGLLDKDQRAKQIFDRLFATQIVKDSLKNNSNFIQNILDTQSFDIAKQVIEQNLISNLNTPATLNGFLNGLTRASLENKELEIEDITFITSKIIENQDLDSLPIYVNKPVNNWPKEIQEIVVAECIKKLIPSLVNKSITFTGLLREGNEEFCRVIANSDTLKALLSDIDLVQEDRDLLFEKSIEASLTASKVVSEQKEKLETFSDEVENTVEHFYKTLNRSKDIEKEMGNSNEDEKQRADVLKRIFLTLGSSGLEVRKPDSEEWISAKNNNLPLAMEFGVGPRVLIEIPQLDDIKSQHEFFNWLTSGEKSGETHVNKNVTTAMSGYSGRSEQKVIYTRPAATHSIGIKNGEIAELKENAIAEGIRAGWKLLGHYSGYTGDNLFTGHFGMDVAVGGYQEMDIHGKTIRPDGSTGHLYMYYQPPTLTSKGGILVGMEGCAPGVAGQYGDHSLFGASDELTVAGGRQSKELATMEKNAIIADRYNARRIKLNNDKLAALYNADLTKINDAGTLAATVAQDSVDELITAANKTKVNAEFRVSKKFTFETVISEKHANFVSNYIKSRLANVINELSQEERPNIEDLKENYKAVLLSLFATNEVTSDMKEQFRKSVELHLASLGRNERYDLVFKVHKELLQKDGEEFFRHGTLANQQARAINAFNNTFFTPASSRATSPAVASSSDSVQEDSDADLDDKAVVNAGNADIPGYESAGSDSDNEHGDKSEVTPKADINTPKTSEYVPEEGVRKVHNDVLEKIRLLVQYSPIDCFPCNDGYLKPRFSKLNTKHQRCYTGDYCYMMNIPKALSDKIDEVENQLVQDKNAAEAKMLADEQKAAQEKVDAEAKKLADEQKAAQEKVDAEAKKLADKQKAHQEKVDAEAKKLADEQKAHQEKADAKRAEDEQQKAQSSVFFKSLVKDHPTVCKVMAGVAAIAIVCGSVYAYRNPSAITFAKETIARIFDCMTETLKNLFR